MGGVFLAEAAVLRKGELFFHLLLITLRIMRNAATSTTLELGHVVLDHSHTRVPLKSNKIPRNSLKSQRASKTRNSLVS